MYYIKGYGAVLYFTKLEDTNVDGKVLSIPGLRDRAYIQIGNVLVGVLDRTKSTELKINLPDNEDLALVILVENTGRLCYGDDLLDSKVLISLSQLMTRRFLIFSFQGILSDVILDGKVITNWVQCLSKYFFPLVSFFLIHYLEKKLSFNKIKVLPTKY